MQFDVDVGFSLYTVGIPVENLNTFFSVNNKHPGIRNLMQLTPKIQPFRLDTASLLPCKSSSHLTAFYVTLNK